jgi:cobalt-precorrin 5A hydrolase
MSGSPKTAIVTLCARGLVTSERIASGLLDSDIYVHESVTDGGAVAGRFNQVGPLSRQLFHRYRRLIFVLPTGVAIRAIAASIKNKYADPAVVAVDVGGRWAISLLSGHEGGANHLAMTVSNILDAEPVISTTSEAAKSLIVGVGCRRGTAGNAILDAIHSTFLKHQLDMADIRLLASVDIKKTESGLAEAAEALQTPVRFISSTQIRECRREIEASPFVEEKVGVPGVAEPAALLAGRRTSLVVPKQKFHAVTVAVARENCFW